MNVPPAHILGGTLHTRVVDADCSFSQDDASEPPESWLSSRPVDSPDVLSPCSLQYWVKCACLRGSQGLDDYNVYDGSLQAL